MPDDLAQHITYIMCQVQKRGASIVKVSVNRRLSRTRGPLRGQAAHESPVATEESEKETGRTEAACVAETDRAAAPKPAQATSQDPDILA